MDEWELSAIGLGCSDQYLWCLSTWDVEIPIYYDEVKHQMKRLGVVISYLTFTSVTSYNLKIMATLTEDK